MFSSTLSCVLCLPFVHSYSTYITHTVAGGVGNFSLPCSTTIYYMQDAPRFIYYHSQISPERRGSGDVQPISSGFTAKCTVYTSCQRMMFYVRGRKGGGGVLCHQSNADLFFYCCKHEIVFLVLE